MRAADHREAHSAGEDKPGTPRKPALERSNLRSMENELRDPKNFAEFFLPRPLRLAFFGASALSTLVATLVSAAGVAAGPALAREDGTLQNLVVNIIGFATFSGLFFWDQGQAEVRVEQRRELRQRQIQFGDRCAPSRADLVPRSATVCPL